MTNRWKYLVSLDILGAAGVLVGVYLVQFSSAPFAYFRPSVPGIARGLVIILSVVFCSYFLELYNRDLRFDLTALAARVAVSVNLCFLALTLFIFMIPPLTMGKRFLAPYLLCFGVIQFCIHGGVHYLERRFGLLPRVLVLGGGGTCRQAG